MKIKNTIIEFLGHSGFLIICSNKKRIAIDPYNLPEIDKVDLILITHSHYDHCSIKDIRKISKKETLIIIPPDAQSKITKVEDVNMQLIEPNEKINWEGIKIETVRAYNTNKQFHKKNENWLGYIVKDNDVIIYHAGDTDKIPEMQKLTGYGKHENDFIVLLPVSGTYVMEAEEAVEAAILLKPSLAIPMHYGAGVAGTIEDATKFVKLCEKNGIRAVVLDKIN